MTSKNLSEEITSVFSYIKEVICKEQPHMVINEYTYILAILNNEKSLAYQALSSIVIEDTLESMKDFFKGQIIYDHITNNNFENSYTVFDEYMTLCNELCKKFNTSHITSSVLLLSIIKKHEVISRQFRNFSITDSQLFNSTYSQLTNLSTALAEIPKKHIKKNRNTNLEVSQPIKVVERPQSQSNTEIERNLINISKLAELGKIPQVLNYDKYYNEVFMILSKKNRNNVAICGKSGVGKTAMAKNLANIINHKNCSKSFHNKTIVEMNFSKLVIGTPFKGAFEQKYYTILEEAKTNGNYIFFIDNLHTLLNPNTKYAETDIESLLETLLSEPSIQVICTMNSKAFSALEKKSILGKYLQEVIIEEPSLEETVDILNKIKPQYEAYHDVLYTDDAIYTCVELCSKYLKNRALPDSAIDLLDIVGSKNNINIEENPLLLDLKNNLCNIVNEIENIKSSSENKEYDKIDDLVQQQIKIKSKIAILEKEEILSKEPSLITKSNVCEVVSEEIDIPLEELTQTEKTRLKGLSNKLKQNVIGQDEAIEEVCRVVKRQRVGLGENERPAVLMFLGSTGTGKTYLAKQLAKEVFGDDKYFVRMDMSEYADKTSVNKISGSSHGYVGYEDDTFLVRALKKKKRFVLLLDEFEKSSEEVHNIFLQIFDEGRFTDNHGEEYSLKDVIIILTSNVGIAESVNRGRAIGFDNNAYDISKTIIEKELKRKFKPEFLNRIQKIIYFNKLDENSLRSIINLEINKINTKIEKIGYHMSLDIKKRMEDIIYNIIKDKKEFGARPIVNEVQRRIEDRITDYIIENEVVNGHVFTFEEISDLDL